MILHFYRHMTALTLLTLICGFLSAQPYQLIHAYDQGGVPITGTYFDVANLSSAAANAGSPVAVGHTFATPQNGLLSEMLTNGSVNSMMEITNPGGNPVISRAICRTPNDDVIACFFDPTAQATDVIRYSMSAGLVWITRLPNFHAKDVICDSANVPSGLGIWLTGQSTVSGRLVIEGLGAAGGLLFATDYALNNPNWTYQASKGFQIALNPGRTRLTVVGTANITGGAQTEMLVVRTNLNGNLIWAKGYGDPNGGDYYHGKCLVLRNGIGNRFVIGFEYSNVASPQNEAGAMTIDAFGNIVWIQAYNGGGFFAGTNYIVEDIDVLNNRLLMAGYFSPSAAAGPAAYTLAVGLNGTPVQYNEYETTGLFPTGETTFHGMDYNPVTNHHVMVGKFTTSTPAGIWPWNGNPNAFWTVAADQLGVANCSQAGGPQNYALNPVVANLGVNVVNLPAPQQSPLVLQAVDPKENTQCGVPKRANATTDLLEEHGQVKIAYRGADGQIVLDIQGEQTGPGSFQLLNLQGQLLAEQPANSNSQTLDASRLSQGVYLVRYAVPGIGRGVRKVMVW